MLRVRTDATVSPDVGHAILPFEASVTLTTTAALPTLGWSAAQTFTYDHSAFFLARTATGRMWTLMTPGDGPTRIELHHDGALILQRGAMVWSGRSTCREMSLWSSPRDYLLELLENPASP